MDSLPKTIRRTGKARIKVKSVPAAWFVAFLVSVGVPAIVVLTSRQSSATHVPRRGLHDARIPTMDISNKQSSRPRSVPIADRVPSIPSLPNPQNMLDDALGRLGDIQEQTRRSRVPPPVPPPQPPSATPPTKPAATGIVSPSPQPAPSRRPQPQAKDLKKQTNSIGMQLVLLPAGRYRMGDEADAVDVTLSKDFWIGKTEVTQSEWKRVMADQRGFYDGVGFNERKGDKFPAVGIHWDDAVRFCDVLTAMERKAGRIDGSQRYRLPTEAEWEYACRAGSTARFCYGDEDAQLTDYAWCYANAFEVREPYAHEVASKKPNAWGLHDMHGNVKEWCLDEHSKKLPGGLNPFVREGGARVSGYKVIRGGAWRDFPHFHQCSYRADMDSTSNGLDDHGFRVVLAAAELP